MLPIVSDTTDLEVLLSHAGIYLLWEPVWTWWCVQDWVLVHVGHQNGLADSWLVVKPGAAISVTACSEDEQRRSKGGCEERSLSVSIVLTAVQDKFQSLDLILCADCKPHPILK